MYLKKSYQFLHQLRQNNNREWFQKNKPLYVEAKDEFELFINNLISEIQHIDSEVDVFDAKECMFRIFRDVRFSKNKEPYKLNFGAFIAKGGRKSPFAGYYIHFQPGDSFIGGGVYMPQPRFLLSIRTKIYEHPEEYKKIINDTEFKKYFNGLFGDTLKTAPRGFPKDFSDIELLKNKHYAVAHHVPDSFWESEHLLDAICDIAKAQYQFNSFLNKAIQEVVFHKNK